MSQTPDDPRHEETRTRPDRPGEEPETGSGRARDPGGAAPAGGRRAPTDRTGGNGGLTERAPAEESPRHARYGERQEPLAAVSGNGTGIAAMVVGMLAVTLAFLVFPALAAILLGIAAIVLGVVGMRNAGRMGGLHKGLSVTGLVTGILALVLGAAVVVGGITLAEQFQDQIQMEDLQEQLPDG